MTVISTSNVGDIELRADGLNAANAATIYKEHGCLVVRGLMTSYIEQIARDIDAAIDDTLSLLDHATQVPEGWTTPNGTLLLPAPAGYDRDKQIMVLGFHYQGSATSTTNRAEAEKQIEQARKENRLGLMVRGNRRYHPR